jgi:flagellar biosynthesis chaperone FliJ
MSDETPEESLAMASEMTALTVLERQVETLTTQLQKLTSERDEFRGTLETISAERDTLRSQAAAPDAQAARISELEASIRDRTHYDKFAELAKGANAKEAALKHLWKVSGYKAEADEIDDKALQTLVARLKTEADYAFDPEPTDVTKAAQEAARTTSRTKYGLDMSEQPPAGGGRANRNQGGDGTIVTQEMRADPKFMLDPKNKEIIRDAAIGGRFR